MPPPIQATMPNLQYVFEAENDISSALGYQIVTTGPDGVRRTFTATLGDDNESAYFVTDADSFPVPGNYEVQLLVTLSDGTVVPSTVVQQYVEANL
jgi:hypothetical protein